MPETQAKSGGPGSSATPVEEEPKKDGTASSGREAAGRAAVPADAPSQPKFTRAPGMAPPPGEPPADSDGQAEQKRPAAGPSVAKGSATVPIVTKGKSGGSAAPGQGAQSGRTGVMPPPAKPATAPQRPGEAPKRPSGGAASGSAAVGAARVSEAVRSARSTVSSAAARGPRRARLNLKRIDPWSVMKFAFAVSVVLFIVVVVATSVLYLSLDAMGVWQEVNTSLQSLVNASGGTDAAAAGGTGFRITAWGVIGTSMLIGAVNVVLFTALATLGAFIYNVCADLVGGVELTLAERD
ncbi:DUF3566 domain-containing protein [Actinoplanes friuliensis]|uniref:DUF3566 domain-containing protein n=1 Tax=Actinoplanes friuliensis DSM 7358 TaxID=1246995 RepID=U5VND6_9ACTN|nr:DUF3566 domain-containing protein [Actinoplanes friuliensis]AGZ38299.1 hypothetical protein AFR_00050 [Actinoplanes friuliensis DSM 7358]